MKTFSIYTAMTVLLTAFAHAAPTHGPFSHEPHGYPPSPGSDGYFPEPANRPLYIDVTFEGAPSNDAFYKKEVPSDGSTFTLNNPLSISHIRVAAGASCTFFGIDGSKTTIVNGQTVDVGPPQTQIKGSCHLL